MVMQESLADVLQEYLERRQHNAAQLARLAGLPKMTLVGWLNGHVRQPRHVEDVIKVAASLHLTTPEIERLLRAAGGWSLQMLAATAQQSHNLALLEALADWQQGQAKGTPPWPPFQAPGQVEDFVGRGDGLALLTTALQRPGALCLIHGMGGVGKTSLAIQLAYQLRPTFPDGILWASLSGPLSLPSILNALAAACGRDISHITDLKSLSQTVSQLLASRRALVVLDNVESNAELELLLPPSDNCSVLITTRNRALAVARHSSAFELLPFAVDESALLFTAVLGQDYWLREQDSLRHVAVLLGNLPLAIRLAACSLALSPGLTPAEYCALLADEQARLNYLEEWSDVGHSIRAVFELSYRLLSPPMQRLWASLALLEGPDFTAEVGAALTEASPAEVKLELGRLTALSLLNSPLATPTAVIGDWPAPGQPVAGRYQWHTLLKLFAGEKIRPSPMAGVYQQRAAAYYVQQIEDATAAAYPALLQDWPNIVGVLRWAYEHAAWELVLRGVQGLTRLSPGSLGFVDTFAFWSVGRTLLGWALTAAQRSRPEAQTAAYIKRGTLAIRQADYEAARQDLLAAEGWLADLPRQEDESWLLKGCWRECMARLLMEQDQDLEGAFDQLQMGSAELSPHPSPVVRQQGGYLMIQSAPLLYRLRRPQQAIEAARQGLALLPDTASAARVGGLNNLGRLLCLEGDSAAGVACYMAGIELAEQLGDRRRLVNLWLNLADAQYKQGALATAVSAYQRLIPLCEHIQDMPRLGDIHTNLGLLYLKLGEAELAETHFQAGVELAARLGLTELQAYTLTNLARWQIHVERYAAADVTLASAETLTQQHHIDLLWPELHRLRAQLVWRTERNLTLALERLERSLQAAAAFQDTLEIGLSRQAQGDILCAAGERAAAATAYKHSLAALADEYPYEKAASQWALARCGWKDRQADSLSLALAAGATFSRLGAEKQARLVQHWLDQMTGSSGKEPEAARD